MFRTSFIFLYLLTSVTLHAQERLSPKEFRKKLDNSTDALLLDVRRGQKVLWRSQLTHITQYGYSKLTLYLTGAQIEIHDATE